MVAVTVMSVCLFVGHLVWPAGEPPVGRLHCQQYLQQLPRLRSGKPVRRASPAGRPRGPDLSPVTLLACHGWSVTAGDGHVMVWQLVEDSSRPLFRFSPPYRWCIWLCDSELTVMLQWPHTWAPCVTQSPRVVILKGRKRSIFVCVFWM